MTQEVKKEPKSSKTKEPVIKEAIVETPVMEVPKTKKKKNLLKYKPDDESLATEYEMDPKKSGIVFMLPQKGVTIYDAEEDTVRQIRYCPNEPSIFVDEQSDNALRESVAFRSSKLFVPKSKPNLRRFLELHPGNKANGGNLFKKVDKRKEAQEELEKEFLVSDAVSIVREKEIVDLLAVAMYFGISTTAPVSEIRYNLLRLAKKNPQQFIEAFDSPQVVCRSTIQQAEDYQIIKLRKEGAYWFDSNGLIVSTPVGQKSIDTMVRFCLTEKGASVLSLIEQKLDKLG